MIKYFISLLFALISLVSFSEVRKSSIAAFSITRSSTKTFENPYIIDGLIAMWDGEWNVGLGKHNSTVIVWKDISGNNRDAVLSGMQYFGENYWHVESVNNKGLAQWNSIDLGTNQTIEVLISILKVLSIGRIIAEGQKIASPIAPASGYGPYMYGYGLDNGTRTTNIMGLHLHQITHASKGTMKYYIDGKLCWEQQASQNSAGDIFGYFANRPSDYTRGIDANYFTIRRYNRVLSDEELQHNYSIDKARFGL